MTRQEAVNMPTPHADPRAQRGKGGRVTLGEIAFGLSSLEGSEKEKAVDVRLVRQLV